VDLGLAGAGELDPEPPGGRAAAPSARGRCGPMGGVRPWRRWFARRGKRRGRDRDRNGTGQSLTRPLEHQGKVESAGV